jgi:hypothetical protein
LSARKRLNRRWASPAKISRRRDSLWAHEPESFRGARGFSNTTHIDEAVACSGMPGFSDEQMGKVKKLWATDFEKLTN